MTRKIIIGSRESRLAVIQSEMVQQYIQRSHPELTVEILTMKTAGDKILNQPLEKIGGKGLFVKELDAALLDGRSDLSVHSLKDVPMELPKELPLIAYSAREDVRDALILPEGVNELDFSKPVGCSSRRRMLQFARLYPQATFAPIRGNVQTRLKKLDSGEYCATILAAAGLKRLRLTHRINRYFTTEEMIPAAGQGILAVQGRAGEDYGFLAGYSDAEAAACAQAERAFVRALGGNCSTPVAAYARVILNSASDTETLADLHMDLPVDLSVGLSSDLGVNSKSGLAASASRQGTDGVEKPGLKDSRALRLDVFYFDDATGKSYWDGAAGSMDHPAELGESLAGRIKERIL
ncbi:MAG: hydroxymethylbilane synthase [Clostridiales bacterium]|nr:hydroxymethylbilane synthase [Clostridiales bacterium]